MDSQFALRQHGRASAVVEKCAVPQPGSGEALIEVAAVALNPIDWKLLYGTQPTTPTTLGCDFAGTVIRVSEDVKDFKVGCRVAGLVAGGNALKPNDGAFAQYITAPANVLLRLPDGIAFEDGATLATPLFTAGLCLFKHLSLPYPDLSEATKPATTHADAQKAVLVYGGGTATGSMQIQLAKLSQLEVYTFCSVESFERMKKYGADHIYDHNDPSSLEALRRATGGKLQAAADCISTELSAAVCAAGMEAAGGKYISFTAAGPKIDDPRITTDKIFAFGILNQEYLMVNKGVPLKSRREDVDFGIGFAKLANQLLEAGLIVPCATEVRPGGLNGIVSGLDDLKAGNVLRKRLVYKIKN